jgi:hypothetical protein
MRRFSGEEHMSITAMKQALERVAKAIDEPNNTMSDAKALKEIMRQLRLIHATLSTAIKQARSEPVQRCALCNYQHGHAIGCKNNPIDIALNKMAENARELGLDYEPWKSSDTAHRPGGLPQDFIKHEVENEGDWSEWVNPDPEQYFMKCCDCGLVHEMQFKVAKYSEGDECEFVADANLQAVFKARRATPPARPAPVQEPVRVEKYIYGTPLLDAMTKDYVPPQRTWVGLTDEEIKEIVGPYGDTPVKGYTRQLFDKIEAKLREKNQ